MPFRRRAHIAYVALAPSIRIHFHDLHNHTTHNPYSVRSKHGCEQQGGERAEGEGIRTDTEYYVMKFRSIEGAVVV